MIGSLEDKENIGIDCLAFEQLINFANQVRYLLTF